MFSWYVPAWPTRELYFNPLAWQILFVFGAWYADEGARRLKTIVQSRASLVLALLYLAFSLPIALSWEIKPLEEFIPDAISKLIYPIYQKSPCALAPAAFFRARYLNLTADAAKLERLDETLDDGVNSLRRKFAGDFLPRRLAVFHGLSNLNRILQHNRYANCYQHCRHRPDGRRSNSNDLDIQTGSAGAKAVLRRGQLVHVRCRSLSEVGARDCEVCFAPGMDIVS